MKPFIRWTGGKQKHMPILKKFIPKDCKYYHEPFLGAGSMFHHVRANDMFESYSISDLNEDLINLWRAMSTQSHSWIADSMFREYSKMSDVEQREYYNEVRQDYNIEYLSNNTPISFMDDSVLEDRAAKMHFLLKCGFNGGWRINQKGRHNLPIGDNRNPSINWKDYDHLRSVTLMDNYRIECESYKDHPIGDGGGSFIFLDPPYYEGPESEFTEYTKESFGVSEQIDLAAWCRKQHYKGNKFLMCNSDNGDGFLEEIYSGFKFHYYEINRGNRKKDGSPHKEVLIYNYEV